MAVKKKRSGVRRGKRGTSPKKTLLPTEKNDVPTELARYSTLLYGAPKIGKTSLAAQFEDAVFFATEPGTKALEVYSVNVTSWEMVEQLIGELDRDTTMRYKTVVVDTVDLMYELALDHVCQQKLIKHPQEENDYGRTWKEIRILFREAIARLISSQRGVVFISHATEKEVDSVRGSYERIQPTMSRQALEEIEGLVDLILYYGYVGSTRAITVRGDQHLIAGSRLQENFNTVSGEGVVSVNAGKSPKDAYRNLLLGFENQLKEVEVISLQEEEEEAKEENPKRSLKKRTARKSSGSKN